MIEVQVMRKEDHLHNMVVLGELCMKMIILLLGIIIVVIVVQDQGVVVKVPVLQLVLVMMLLVGKDKVEAVQNKIESIVIAEVILGDYNVQQM
eukprot:5199097-Ditylum_brightwellii.AAC.1